MIERKSLIAASVALLLLVATAEAKDLHVPSKAYRTIKSAVRKARPGDTIFVHPGFYDEPNILLRRRGVTISGDQAVWSGRGERSRTLTIRAKNCQVSGFRFEDLSVRVRGPRCIVSDNVFTGTSRREVAKVSGNAVQVLRNTLVDVALDNFNRFSENTASNRNGPGAELSGDTLEVEDNTFYGTGVGRIVVVLIEGDFAIVQSNLIDDCRVVNSTVDGIRVNGSDNIVRRCSSEGGSDEGIYVHGADSLIEDVTSTGAGESALFVSGDRNEVVRATLSGVARGLHIGGNDNTASASSLRATDKEGLRIFGSRNVISDCGIGGGTLGAYVQKDGNELTRCTVTAAGGGVHVNGSQNRLSDVDIVAGTGPGVVLIGGYLNAFVRCVTRGGTPGFQIDYLAFDTTLQSCEILDALNVGLRHDGLRTTVIDCTIRGSAVVDVSNSGTFTLVENNVFDTGGF